MNNGTIQLGRKFGGGQGDPDIGCKKAAEITAKVKRKEDVSESDIAFAFQHILECPHCNTDARK